MEEKRLILENGKKDCKHKFETKDESWEEAPETGPVMSKLPKWRYNAWVDVCTKCGRKELTGGTVIVPETPGHYIFGEYKLLPNGDRGMCITC